MSSIIYILRCAAHGTNVLLLDSCYFYHPVGTSNSTSPKLQMFTFLSWCERDSNARTVTHPSSNRAQRKLTKLRWSKPTRQTAHLVHITKSER